MILSIIVVMMSRKKNVDKPKTWVHNFYYLTFAGKVVLDTWIWSAHGFADVPNELQEIFMNNIYTFTQSTEHI